MLQIVFRSQLTTLLSYLDIQRICLAAARNNRKAAVSGFMVECGGVFLQSLEGPVHVVNETLDRMYRDNRHDHIEIVCSEQDIPQRRFEVWAMNVMFLDDDAFWTRVFGSEYSCDEMLTQRMDPAFAMGILAMAYRHACSETGLSAAAAGNRLGRIPQIRHMIRR